MRITGLTQKVESWAAKIRPLYWITAQYYRSVIQREIGLANITVDDHILCIGGGNCPFSAILLHQTTGAKVTVIDNNDTCLRDARQVIDSLGLGGHIRVLCQDGCCPGLPLAEYSVIHIALQVYPMEDVFSHVEKSVSPGTKLLVRRPKKTLSKMYSCLHNSMLRTCRHIKHRAACNIGSTLLYVKQGAVV